MRISKGTFLAESFCCRRVLESLRQIARSIHGAGSVLVREGIRISGRIRVQGSKRRQLSRMKLTSFNIDHIRIVWLKRGPAATNK